MSSPVQCLASEIAGLLQDHQARLKTTPKASQLTLESYSRILPQHISAALQQFAMVSKEKTASAPDFDPEHSSYWSDVTVTLSLVPITMHLPPSLQVSQFATQCMKSHLDDTKLLKCVQHSLWSAMCSEIPTATPSYFYYPTGKTRASMPIGHWCEITEILYHAWLHPQEKSHICNANLVEGCTT